MEYDDEYVKILDFEWLNPRITVLYNNGTVQTIDDVYDVQVKQIGMHNVLMIVSGMKMFYVNPDSVCYWSVENWE